MCRASSLLLLSGTLGLLGAPDLAGGRRLRPDAAPHDTVRAPGAGSSAARRVRCGATGAGPGFDFWIGHWSVRVRGAAVGTNRIEPTANRCGLIERWRSDAGAAGESLTWFDRHARTWRQVRLSGDGVVADYAGGWHEGKLVLLTPPVAGADGRSARRRMTFTPVSGDSLAQVLEESVDAGRTWTPTFDAIYVRLVPDSVAVHRRATGIIDADNHRDLARAVEAYAPNAVLVPPDGREVQGRENIRPRYQALFDSNQPELRTTIDELVVFGDWALVRGRNEGFFRPLAGGSVRAVRDVYLEILRRDQDGQWRIARLMWHPAPRQ